jgi:hypothetical protein
MIMIGPDENEDDDEDEEFAALTAFASLLSGVSDERGPNISFPNSFVSCDSIRPFMPSDNEEVIEFKFKLDSCSIIYNIL